eukprot:6201001-Pleurochrysis_carterae.AAC.3
MSPSSRLAECPVRDACATARSAQRAHATGFKRRQGTRAPACDASASPHGQSTRKGQRKLRRPRDGGPAWDVHAAPLWTLQTYLDSVLTPEEIELITFAQRRSFLWARRGVLGPLRHGRRSRKQGRWAWKSRAVLRACAREDDCIMRSVVSTSSAMKIAYAASCRKSGVACMKNGAPHTEITAAVNRTRAQFIAAVLRPLARKP